MSGKVVIVTGGGSGLGAGTARAVGLALGRLLSEAITDGTTGLVAPVDQPAAWVAALKRLAADDALAEGDIVVERALDAGYRMLHCLVDAQRRQPLPERMPPDLTVFAAGVPVIERITGMGVHRGMLACFALTALLAASSQLPNQLAFTDDTGVVRTFSTAGSM